MNYKEIAIEIGKFLLFCIGIISIAVISEAIIILSLVTLPGKL